MSNIFAQVTQDTEAVEDGDRLGGASSVIPTNIYDAIVKDAYIIESKNGALGIVLTLDADGNEITETNYITNRQKSITYKDKKSGEAKFMVGYSIYNALSLLVSSKSILENDTPEQTRMLWDYESKKELPQQVPVLEEWLGKPVKVAIQEKIEAKTGKNDDGEYVPQYDDNSGELVTYKTNAIVKFYRERDNMTVFEITNGAEAAEHHDKWLAKNKDKVWDTTTNIPKTVAVGAKSGNLGGGGATPTAAKKVLFN